MQAEQRPLAPLDLLPPEFEKTLSVLERLPKYKRRQWLRAKRPEYPRFIYRYMGPEIQDKFLSDYLVDSHFYLNSIAKFNDPFDMGAHVVGNGDWKKRLQKFKKIVKDHNPHLNWKQRQERVSKIMCVKDQLLYLREGYEKSVRDIGAICFTPDPRNLLMWSHYAAHHRGFVLQFHTAFDLRKLNMLIKMALLQKKDKPENDACNLIDYVL